MKNLKHQRLTLIFLLLLSLTMHLIYGIEGAAQYNAMEHKLQQQAAMLQDKQEQIELLEIMLEQEEEELKAVPVSLGEFTITHYCPCVYCCNKSDGITYTGTQATEGRTIAVDPEVIPLGSTVIIDGQEYIAEDIGGAIKGLRIDKYMDNHQEALDAGIVQAEVWIGG